MSNIILTAAAAAMPVITMSYFVSFFLEPYKALTDKKVPRAFRPTLYNVVTGEIRDLSLVECLRYGQVRDDITKMGVQLYTTDGRLPMGQHKSQKAAACLVNKGIMPYYITKGEFSEYFTPIAEKYAEITLAVEAKDTEKVEELNEERKALECIRFSTYKKYFDVDPAKEEEAAKHCLTIRAGEFAEKVLAGREYDEDDHDQDNHEPAIINEDDMKLSAFENATRSKEAEDLRKAEEGKSEIEIGYEKFAAALRYTIVNNPSIYDGLKGLPEDHGFNGENWGEILGSSYRRYDDPEGLTYAQVNVWKDNEIVGQKDLTLFGVFVRTWTCKPLLGDRIYCGCIGCTLEDLKGYEEWKANKEAAAAAAEANAKEQALLAAKFAKYYGAPDIGVKVGAEPPHAAKKPIVYDELPDEVLDMPF